MGECLPVAKGVRMYMRDVVGKAIPVRSRNIMLLSQVFVNGEGILTGVTALDDIGIEVAANGEVNGRHCPARMKVAGVSATLATNISTRIP